MYADAVICLVLASGAGAGFGSSNDPKRYVGLTYWPESFEEPDLRGFFYRGAVAATFLLARLALSACAAVASTKLRIRAPNDAGA